MEKRKKSKSGFLIKIIAVLAVLAAVVFGVYFALDKLVVPKYFKNYGITNMHDLVAMMKTLYNSPNEDELISNGYLPSDLKSATEKLKKINFPTDENGKIDYIAVSEGINREDLVIGNYEFTDREIAAIINQMLEAESGVLASQLPNIKYIDIININILEIIITPNIKAYNGDGDPIYDTDSANILFTCKVNTSAVREQMAKAMDTPLFLLNMIVPETLYITVDYDMEKNADGDWKISKGDMAVNGRTTKDSKILLDLLVEFMVPEEEKMTVDKLAEDFGNIVILSLDIFGDVQILGNINGEGSSGVVFKI